jgi:hypothetical protein
MLNGVAMLFKEVRGKAENSQFRNFFPHSTHKAETTTPIIFSLPKIWIGACQKCTSHHST